MIQSPKFIELLLLKILLCLSSLPRYHSFAPLSKQIIPLSNMGYVPFKKKMKGQRIIVSMVMDPSDIVVSTIQSNMDTMTTDNLSNSSPLLPALLSTMYTATSGASKHAQQWSFLWFQGGPVDPYSTGHSIVPTDIGKMDQMQDFFTPDSISGAFKNTMDPLYKNTDTLPTPLTKSADLIRINSALPGAPRSLPDPQTTAYTYNTKIDKREIETIASHFDLVIKKIPLAVTLFALVDFFGFGGKDVWNTELEENRPKAAVDWVVQSSIRVGIAVGIVWVTVFVSKWTYHPI